MGPRTAADYSEAARRRLAAADNSCFAKIAATSPATARVSRLYEKRRKANNTCSNPTDNCRGGNSTDGKQIEQNLVGEESTQQNLSMANCKAELGELLWLTNRDQSGKLQSCVPGLSIRDCKPDSLNIKHPNICRVSPHVELSSGLSVTMRGGRDDRSSKFLNSKGKNRHRKSSSKVLQDGRREMVRDECPDGIRNSQCDGELYLSMVGVHLDEVIVRPKNG